MIKVSAKMAEIVITQVHYIGERVTGCDVTVDGKAQQDQLAVPFPNLGVGDRFEAVRQKHLLLNWRRCDDSPPTA